MASCETLAYTALVSVLAAVLGAVALVARVRNWLCEHLAALAWVGLAGGALFLLMPALLALCGWDFTTAEWRFWLQTVAGNRSPDAYPPLVSPEAGAETNSLTRLSARYWYAFAAILAVLLNNGLIILLIGLVWRLSARVRKVLMNVKQALATRDEMIEQALLNEFSNDENLVSRVEKALKSARHSWPGHLRAIFGNEADDFLSRHDLNK